MRRIISLQYPNRKDRGSYLRNTRADVDKAKPLAVLASRPRPTEGEIDAPAAEDRDALTDEELAHAESVCLPPSAQFARVSG